MSKIDTLVPVTNLSTGSGATTINDNFEKITTAFQNTLSRDGSTPNQMSSDIDMNGNDLLNVNTLQVDGTLSVDNIVVDGIDLDAKFVQVNQAASDAAASAAEAAMWAGVAQTVTLPNGSVTLVKLASNSVDASKIVDGSVGTNEMANDAITYAKLQNLATARILGRVTAGSGDAEELTAAQLRDSFFPVGSVIDSASATPYTANTNLTTVIPSDDTIPQITEGTQILSVSITPKSTTNKLRVVFQGFGATDAQSRWFAALFLNGAVNAVAGSQSYQGAANEGGPATIVYEYVPGSIAAQNFTLRVGPAAGILRMNGHTSARFLGGVMSCTLTVDEIKQ